MTRPDVLQDLLALPATVDGDGSHRGIDDMVDALLRRLRDEEHAAIHGCARDHVGALTPEAGDALYAWGVLCYDAGRNVDAAALFGAVARRRQPSPRLWRALGANHLALGDAARAAEAFAQLHRLSPDDAEALYFWAEAECLLAHGARVRELLQAATDLARAQPGKWPALEAWCDELRSALDASLSPES